MIPAVYFSQPWWWQLLAESALKSSLILVVGGVAALALCRSSAAIRHAVWTTAMAGALVVAPLALVLPAIRVRTPDTLAETLTRFAPPQSAVRSAAPAKTGDELPLEATATRDSETSPPATEPHFSLSTWLAIWAAGTLVLSCTFLAAGLRIAGTARKLGPVMEPSIDRLAQSVAQQLGVASARVRLRWTDRELTPMTWGLWRPVLILPVVCKTWDEERLNQALIHEIGHIQRWDVLTQAIGNGACALYWFNPLVWIAARQMLVERERACDDLVLESGAKPSSYAHGLLEIARSLGARWATARVSPAMARRSQISGRLLAVLDPGRSRQGLRPRAALLAALAGAALIAPLAALHSATPVQAAQAVVPQASASGAPDPLALLAERDAIAAVYEEWKSAVRRRDAHAISLLYTADGMVVDTSRAPVRGRQALEDLYHYFFDLGLAGIEVHTQEMYAVGDLIFEVGNAEALTSGGGVLSASRYMTLWKKEKGKWRVHRDYLSE